MSETRKRKSADPRTRLLPERLPNGCRRWTSAHYDKAADAVMNSIGISPIAWGKVRQAIRAVLETPGVS